MCSLWLFNLTFQYCLISHILRHPFAYRSKCQWKSIFTVQRLNHTTMHQCQPITTLDCVDKTHFKALVALIKSLAHLAHHSSFSTNQPSQHTHTHTHSLFICKVHRLTSTLFLAHKLQLIHYLETIQKLIYFSFDLL